MLFVPIAENTSFCLVYEYDLGAAQTTCKQQLNIIGVVPRIHKLTSSTSRLARFTSALSCPCKQYGGTRGFFVGVFISQTGRLLYKGLSNKIDRYKRRNHGAI